jgi:hypothetical protein
MQHLRLHGGSVFSPREMDSGTSGGGARGGRKGGGRADETPTLSVRVHALASEERAIADMLPSKVVLPLDAANFAVAYRKLIASPPEGSASGRDMQMSVVCTAAEQAVAASGFAAVADQPDSLAAFATVYASSVAEAERQAGRGGGGRGGFDPARPQQRSSGGLDDAGTLRVLKDILLAAPVLGRHASLTMPPYDGVTAEHAEDRRVAI